MEVRLPDGTIIQNVPDGTTKADLVAKLKRNGMSVPSEWTAPATQAAPVPAAERFAQGMRDPIDGGAQLLTKMLPAGLVDAGNKANNWLADKTGLVGRLPEGGVDQQVREGEADLQARRKAAGQPGMDWARAAGNVLSPATLALVFGAPAAAATTLPARIGLGSVGGAASSALSPVEGDDFWASKGKQVGVGALVGGAIPGAAGALGRVISPKASTNPALDLLQAEGVRPTVGQSLGGRWNALEEKFQSVPIVGDAIANARGRSLKQFNEAAINRATAPVGAKVDGVGHQAVADAGNVLSQAYDDALSQLKWVRLDKQFTSDFQQLQGMAQSLTPPMRAKFNATAKDVLGGRTSTGGTMLAETVKKVDSELGNQAARYGRSSVASEQELADALKQLQALLREQVGRTSPEASKAIKAADTGWANLVRVEGAAKAAKNSDGVFTPGQLNTAIQTADKSVRKRSVSRGEALMQDLGSAGQNVLGNKVPNSFTADRALIAGGSMGAYLLNPMIPAGLLAGAGLYTPAGQWLLRNAVTARPESAKAIAEALKKASPMLGPAGGLLGLQVAE